MSYNKDNTYLRGQRPGLALVIFSLLYDLYLVHKGQITYVKHISDYSGWSVRKMFTQSRFSQTHVE